MFDLIIRLLSLFLLGMSPFLQAHPACSSSLNFLNRKALREECQKRAQMPLLLLQNVFILLDPGHGGHDTGAQSISKPRYQEKSLNLVTAKFVKEYLEQLGYGVLMTREEDEFISLDRRVQIANDYHATLFVSIHYNSAPSAQAQGVEVFFYPSKEKRRTVKSKRLAQAVLKNVLLETKAKSRGVKPGNFLVIRETTMPAILVEGGFVSNEEELQDLKDPTYLKRLAWGIVRGIEEYIYMATLKPRLSGRRTPRI